MSLFVPREPAAPRRRALSRFRTALATLAVLGAGAMAPAAASAAISPQYDPFYVPPADLASHAPGDVLRSRTVPFHMSPQIKLPYKAYQVLFRTNDLRDGASASVATIFIPTKRPATGRRLVSYQTAYDGVGPGCRPSYSFQNGKVALQGVETLLIGSALSHGWTIVTTDYEGPYDEFGVGKTSGWNVLDGIRAAERFPAAGLADGVNTPVGMLGYSGGGQATAWAAELAKPYAPELKIIGAAQGGVGADLSTVLSNFDGQLFAGVGLAGIIGISNAYPQLGLEGKLSNRGRQLFKRMRTQSACISDYAFEYAFTKFKSLTIDPTLLKQAPFVAAAQENSLGKDAPQIPVLWYDTLVNQMGSHATNLKVAKQYCAAGTPLSFRTSWHEEHAMQAFSWPFKAQAWISLRFNGAPLDTNCDNLK
ncbi:MAG: lipase family protein [Solirubrobacteraceae bacterium]|nr:lipase family protein [Patulibacter sp.]